MKCLSILQMLRNLLTNGFIRNLCVLQYILKLWFKNLLLKTVFSIFRNIENYIHFVKPNVNGMRVVHTSFSARKVEFFNEYLSKYFVEAKKIYFFVRIRFEFLFNFVDKNFIKHERFRGKIFLLKSTINIFH